MLSADYLRGIAFWARNLTDDEVERIRKTITEKTVQKGAYVCHRGDKLDYWMGVASGLLRLGTMTQMGKTVTLAGLPPGEWFGEGSILKNVERQYDLVALRESKLAMMPRATFIWLYENSPGFNRFLVSQLNERLGQFIGMVENDRALDATGRLARCIAWLYNPVLNPKSDGVLEINQEEIGLLSGLSRQATNRALQTLEKERLLELHYAGMRVLDLEKLRGYGA